MSTLTNTIKKLKDCTSEEVLAFCHNRSKSFKYVIGKACQECPLKIKNRSYCALNVFGMFNPYKDIEISILPEKL